MSYILDAIKKADQKRKLGTVPDVHTEHDAPLEEPRRPGWLYYGLAAILIVNAVGIGWWLWSGAPAKTTVARQAQKPGAAQAGPKAKTGPAQAAKATPSPVAPPPAAKPQPVAGAQVASVPHKEEATVPPPPSATAKAEKPSAVVGGGTPLPPQPAAQAQLPGEKPVTQAVLQSAAKPASVAPPPSPPASKPPLAAVGAQGQGSPPGLQAVSPPGPPQAGKVEPPSKAVGGLAPSTPAPATQAPSRRPEAKPSSPAVAQTGVAKEPPVTQPPPAPAVKTPAIAAADKGKSKGAPPAAKAAAVVPVLTPEEENAAEPEESLSEADEAPADEKAEAEAGAAGQDLEQVASGPEEKVKGSKADKESEEDPELAKIPLLRQLPADVQQSIPALHLSFHFYSLKPSARLVSIGGKILREGQAVDENLTLERITIKGVVLDFKGRRFRLEM